MDLDYPGISGRKSKNHRKSTKYEPQYEMTERRPLKTVTLSPPEFIISTSILVDSYLEKEVQFAGFIDDLPIDLDVTNRTDVLRVVDKGKRESKIAWKLKPCDDAIFILNINDVKLCHRDGLEELIIRIPIHEMAAMSYIRDDNQHILAIKHGVPEPGDETCKLTVLNCDSRTAEELCALVSQCFYLIYTEATMQFFNTKLTEGATASLYSSSNFTTSTTTRSDYSNSNRSTPSRGKKGLMENSKLGSGSGFLTSSHQDISMPTGTANSANSNPRVPQRKTSNPAEAEGASAQELVQQYMNRLHTKLNNNELYQFAMLLKAWYTNMPFIDFCTKAFELYGPDRKYLLAAMGPFIPERDYPEYEAFLEKIGVPLNAGQSDTLGSSGYPNRYRRTVSAGSVTGYNGPPLSLAETQDDEPDNEIQANDDFLTSSTITEPSSFIPKVV